MHNTFQQTVLSRGWLRKFYCDWARVFGCDFKHPRKKEMSWGNHMACYCCFFRITVYRWQTWNIFIRYWMIQFAITSPSWLVTRFLIKIKFSTPRFFDWLNSDSLGNRKTTVILFVRNTSKQYKIWFRKNALRKKEFLDCCFTVT